MFEWLSILSAHFKWSLYGLLGALVGIAHDAYKGKKDTWARKGLRIFVSTALAHVVGNSDLVDRSYLASAGFFTGYFSMAIMEAAEIAFKKISQKKLDSLDQKE